MDKVSYEEIEDLFNNYCSEDAEPFLREILWEALEKQGLTSYSNEKEQALCFVYAFVIQMLCDEFFYIADEIDYYYEYEFPDEEPLSAVAVGWLYRDALGKQKHLSNIDDCFTTVVYKMFTDLVIEHRRTVAEPIFSLLGEDLLGKLFFFAVHGRLLNTNYDYDIDTEAEPFKSKEEFLSYCQNCPFDIIGDFPEYTANRLMDWLYSHSCAVDD